MASDEISDAVSASVQCLLDLSGGVCTYTTTGGSSSSKTLFQSDRPPLLVDVGGQITEIIIADFIGLASAFSADPVRGDKITTGNGGIYEVRPLSGGKPFYSTAGQIRIHTQRIS